MSKKLVYFIETRRKINGVQTIIPDILEKMPSECDVETFYMNFYKNQDTPDILEAPGCANNESLIEKDKNAQDVLYDENSSLKFVNLDNCDFSEFKDATFIVPLNYLFFLLPYVSQYKSIKICPYIYDENCFTNFFKQIKRPNIKEIVKMLNESNSCLFRDGARTSGWVYGIDQFGECVIPESTERYICNPTIKHRFDPEHISIAWIGDVSKTALGCINRICEDLYNLFGVDDDGSRTNMNMFDFHIIGSGAIMGQVNFRKFNPLIRFIFPGSLKDVALDEYITENIDVSFGYNMNAVRGAICNTVTLIPAIDDDPVYAKRTYVYFKDIDDFNLCWKKRELHEYSYNDYTMKEVIDRLISTDLRKIDTSECYNLALKHFSFIENAKRISEFAENSSLTVETLLSNDSISGVLEQFNNYRDNLENSNEFTYYDYFNRNKKI